MTGKASYKDNWQVEIFLPARPLAQIIVNVSDMAKLNVGPSPIIRKLVFP